MTDTLDSQAGVATVDRAFGAENRNRLINIYFGTQNDKDISPSKAWEHVYRLLLWSDPTTGLAHCYESDKCQPGKPWYARSLAFHDWVCAALGTSPADLAQQIDWLFIKACKDLTAEVLSKASARAATARKQRQPYEGRDFPKAGEDPELISLIKEIIDDHLGSEPSSETWQVLAQRVRQYLALQNKRKNLVGEGFEDVLTQVVRRTCNVPTNELYTRSLLYELPGFNRAKRGEKENKVDLAIIRPTLRTLVTAKWSVRADREKQFPTEFEEYVAAESEGKRFEYVFVTNEFDPARLMRACEKLSGNAPMFNHVVHINTDALKATYGECQGESKKNEESRRKVIKYIDSGRLTNLEQWLNHLAGS